MRILIVTDFVEKIGGVEMYNYELKRLLEDRGHQVKIVGGRIEGNDIYRFFGFSNDPHACVRFATEVNNLYKSFFSSWFNIKYKKLIGHEINDFKPNIIFAHSLVANISPSFLLEAKKKNVPVVLTLPTLSQYKSPEISLGKPYRILTLLKVLTHRFLVKRYVDKFIAPSKIAAKCLKRDLEVKDIEIIPYPHLFWQVRDQVHEFQRNIIRLLYVGRLDRFKGVEYLIDAYSRICEEFDDDTVLDIIGEGSDENRLRKLAMNNNPQCKINFKGYIPHEEIKEEYAKADIFVSPTIIEENGEFTIFEAMSQGIPIITTNIGGQAESVKEGYNGFLVNPKDSNDLAEKISIILKNEDLRRQMSKNSLLCAKEFARRFSPEKHIKEIENLFKTVMENYKDR